MAIIIDPTTLLFNLSGAPIRDFPSTGTILQIARGQPPSTYIPSFGVDAFVFGPAWWNISVTVNARGESDNWFEANLRAFLSLKKTLEASASDGPTPIFSSVAMGITNVPDIQYAADGFPMRTWVLTGKCTAEPSAGIYVAATAATTEEVQNA